MEKLKWLAIRVVAVEGPRIARLALATAMLGLLAAGLIGPEAVDACLAALGLSGSSYRVLPHLPL